MLSKDLPEALATLSVRPLFVMRLDVRPVQHLGETPAGGRRVGVVFGGAFEGDRLAGEVLDGGSDWQTVRSDGAVTLDVRLMLRTDDGALIGMAYTGLRAGPAEVIARIDAGETVDPASYYFRTSPRFETSAPRYAWLNRILAVGVGHRRADGPLYSVFEVM